MILHRFGRKRPRPGSVLIARGQQPPRRESGTWMRGLLFLGAWLVLVAAMTRYPAAGVPVSLQDIDAQAIAKETVRAEFFLETENIKASEEKRDAAAAAIPETYSVDRARISGAIEEADRRIHDIDELRPALDKAIRQALLQSTEDEMTGNVVARTVTDFSNRVKEEPEQDSLPDAVFLSVWLTPMPESLPQRQFAAKPGAPNAARQTSSLEEPSVTPVSLAYRDSLAELTRDGLEYVLSLGIMDPEILRNMTAKTIVVLRDRPYAGQAVTEEMPPGQVPELRYAGDLLRARIVEKAKQLASKMPEGAVNWAELQGAAYEMAEPCLADTLSYDRVATEGARSRARAGVTPIMNEIQPGEILQRAGERWTEQSRANVKAYLQAVETGPNPTSRVVSSLFAQGIFAAMALYFLEQANTLVLSRRQLKIGMPRKDISRNLALTLLLVCSTLVIGRVAYYFEPSGLSVPVASIGILLAILVNARFAAMTSFVTAALLSALFGYDWRVLVVGCAMSFAAVSGIYIVRRRSDMTRAAFRAALFGILAVFAITLASDSVFSEAATRRLALVGVNGALCLLIVPALLAPLERLFGITTDIQLLEYSDLNNDVLRRMAVEVPATFTHSLMLGQLAEAAAEAIGANGLLARVCAYYHDVGKLRRPEYFSENQNGVNIHDELSPRLSARAIAAHVTQGVEMAKEFHLPQPVIDGISEHHGTSLISFFYRDALEQQKHGDVREENFRYPGPKPQRRETAILMICDAVESGVRSIKNPNEERIREFVDKIITARSEDRQFDDCNLTLKELDTIETVVAQRVLTMLHTRVAYPEPPHEKREAHNVIRISGSGGSE